MGHTHCTVFHLMIFFSNLSKFLVIGVHYAENYTYESFGTPLVTMNSPLILNCH